jgi:hypothetical protein
MWNLSRVAVGRRLSRSAVGISGRSSSVRVLLSCAALLCSAGTAVWSIGLPPEVPVVEHVLGLRSGESVTLDPTAVGGDRVRVILSCLQETHVLAIGLDDEIPSIIRRSLVLESTTGALMIAGSTFELSFDVRDGACIRWAEIRRNDRRWEVEVDDGSTSQRVTHIPSWDGGSLDVRRIALVSPDAGSRRTAVSVAVELRAVEKIAATPGARKLHALSIALWVVGLLGLRSPDGAP